jgi:hypothetical protein
MLEHPNGFTSKEFGVWRGNTNSETNLQLLGKLRDEGLVLRVGRGLFSRWASIKYAKSANETLAKMREESLKKGRDWQRAYLREWKKQLIVEDPEASTIRWVSEWSTPEITGPRDVFSYAQSYAQ